VLSAAVLTPPLASSRRPLPARNRAAQLAAARAAAVRSARLRSELADVNAVLSEVDGMAASLQAETRDATEALRARAAAAVASFCRGSR